MGVLQKFAAPFFSARPVQQYSFRILIVLSIVLSVQPRNTHVIARPVRRLVVAISPSLPPTLPH